MTVSQLALFVVRLCVAALLIASAVGWLKPL